MEFGDYVRLIVTFWRSIVLTVVVGAGAAVGISFAMTPQYTASAQVLFTPVSSTASGQDLAFSAQYVQSRMVAYQGLVTTPQVLGVVVSGLSLAQTPTELADDVTAKFDGGSTLMTVEVKNTSASQASRTVQAVSNSLINAVTAAEVQQVTDDKGVTQTASRVKGQLVTTPSVPSSPSSPDFKLNIAAGVLLGLILGLAQAAVRFLRQGRSGPAQSSQRSSFARTPPSAGPGLTPLTTVQPPKAPRGAKPKEQKRPGKRTRR